MEIISQIITVLITQCPVLGGLIWFLIIHTKETNRRFAEQAKQYEVALDKVVAAVSTRLDRIDDKISDLKDLVTKNNESL